MFAVNRSCLEITAVQSRVGRAVACEARHTAVLGLCGCWPPSHLSVPWVAAVAAARRAWPPCPEAGWPEVSLSYQPSWQPSQMQDTTAERHPAAQRGAGKRTSLLPAGGWCHWTTFQKPRGPSQREQATRYQWGTLGVSG